MLILVTVLQSNVSDLKGFVKQLRHVKAWKTVLEGTTVGLSICQKCNNLNNFDRSGPVVSQVFAFSPLEGGNGHISTKKRLKLEAGL